MSVLYSNSRIFVIPVYSFNGRKQTLVDMIGILSALCMRGLYDKRHLLAKLRIFGSENSLCPFKYIRTAVQSLYCYSLFTNIWIYCIKAIFKCQSAERYLNYCPRPNIQWALITKNTDITNFNFGFFRCFCNPAIPKILFKTKWFLWSQRVR